MTSDKTAAKARRYVGASLLTNHRYVGASLLANHRRYVGASLLANHRIREQARSYDYKAGMLRN